MFVAYDCSFAHAACMGRLAGVQRYSTFFFQKKSHPGCNGKSANFEVSRTLSSPYCVQSSADAG